MASNFSEMTLRIASLVEPNAPVIRNSTFRQCIILGPAVIAPIGSGSITNSRFDADPSGLFWVPAEGTSKPSGVIIVDSCIFDNCTFVGVGLATTRENLEKMKQGFGPAASEPRGGMNVQPPIFPPPGYKV